MDINHLITSENLDAINAKTDRMVKAMEKEFEAAEKSESGGEKTYEGELRRKINQDESVIKYKQCIYDIRRLGKWREVVSGVALTVSSGLIGGTIFLSNQYVWALTCAVLGLFINIGYVCFVYKASQKMGQVLNAKVAVTQTLPDEFVNNDDMFNADESESYTMATIPWTKEYIWSISFLVTFVVIFLGIISVKGI